MSSSFRARLRRTYVLAALGLSTAAHASNYNLTLFGQPTGGQQSIARGVTNAGLVVGAIGVFPDPQNSLTRTAPFRSIGGVTTVLSLSSTGGLRAANSSGMAVGDDSSSGFFWDGATSRSAAMLRASRSQLFAINDSGITAGSIIVDDGQSFAATWDASQFNPMPTPLVGLDPNWPFGGQRSTGLGITATGIVVGNSVNAAGLLRPVVWAPSATVAELSTGSFSSGSVQATTSDGSFMAGYVNGGGLDQFAARWNQGLLSVLGRPAGAYSAVASAINSGGTVVGSLGFGTITSEGGVSNAVFRAAMWSAGQVFDFNDLVDPAQLPAGAVISSARGINDAGAIVGQITLADRKTQAFLLTPVSAVPEPANALLLLSGLAVVGFLAHRRGRRGSST